jgi:ring-1,2-phenylacetyl-CoA epoxidase subunit PaaC
VSTTANTLAPLAYVLQLADTALVLGQRNAEWCGHGPALEEDIALANNSLDLIGQARMLYSLAGERSTPACTEDHLAYWRGPEAFRNYTLVELPHHGAMAPSARQDRDFATTLVRNFLFSNLMVGVWAQLERSPDDQLAAIAAKAIKETRYHLRHAHDWVVRLGDGTDTSHARAQAALNHLLPYTQEFWCPSEAEQAAMDANIGLDLAALQAPWQEQLSSTLQMAQLQASPTTGFMSGGKNGIHSEHLSYLLAEMQSLARAHPQAVW